MSAPLALLVNLVVLGLAVTALTAALLVLLRRAPSRLRYVVALGGFALAIAAGVAATREAPPVRMAASTAADAGANRAETGPALVDATRVAVVVWALGAAVLLTREARAHRRLARQRRTWTAAPADLRGQLSLPDERPLLLADVPSPRTDGWLRPAIVLPRAFAAQGDATVRRLVVAHEEAHARWRDPLVQQIVRVLRALAWVSPAAWLGEWLLVRERESAADDAALRRADDETCASYASTLVAYGRLASHHDRCLATVPLGATAHLDYRVRRILGVPRRPALATLLAATGAVAAAWAVYAVPPARVAGPVVLGSAAPATGARAATGNHGVNSNVDRRVDVDRHVDVHRDVHVHRADGPDHGARVARPASANEPPLSYLKSRVVVPLRNWLRAASRTHRRSGTG